MKTELSTEQMAKLKSLYLDGSKHSRYQRSPDFLGDILGTEELLNPLWRDDKPRLELLLRALEFEAFSTVTEIGANTGYFCLSLANHFKNLEVRAFEGNTGHAEFISSVAQESNISNLTVFPEYIIGESIDRRITSDVIIHFNVLHHMGVDFFQNKFTLENFKENAINALRTFNPVCNVLAFQMGFNWGGDKSKPIVPVTADYEKIVFLSDLMTSSDFAIEKVALASRVVGEKRFEYHLHSLKELLDLKEHAAIVKRYQHESESEFFRRPIIFAVPHRCEVGPDKVSLSA